MYTLNVVDSFRIVEPLNTYIYDIVPTEAGIAIISSDDNLHLLNPLALSGPPLSTFRRVHSDVTCLKAVNANAQDGGFIVCTAGRDGRVCLFDPRTGSQAGQVNTGMYLVYPLFSKQSTTVPPLACPFLRSTGKCNHYSKEGYAWSSLNVLH